MAKTPETTGYVLWRGPSAFNPSREIVCVVTIGKSKNPKTGAMPQVWILDAQTPPNTAYYQRTMGIRSICGDCKHVDEGSCYVGWGRAVLNVWRKLKRRGYKRAPLSVWRMLRKRGVRMGAGGDPAALPLAITRILRPATAYTHQWDKPEFQGLREWAMASCDNPMERNHAQRLGWRVFEVTVPGQAVPEGSIICPTETHDIECDTCKLCQGTRKQAKSISIPVHGATASRFIAYRKRLHLPVFSQVSP